MSARTAHGYTRSMNITLRTHHATIEDGLRAHAEKKLARLDRYLPRVDSIVIEVAHEETRAAAHRYRVQVTVHSSSSILRAEEQGAEARTAFDAAADVIARQAQRHGKRLHDRHRDGPARDIVEPVAPPKRPALDDGEVEEYLLGKVIRSKQFEAKPMSPEEALAQMDLLGHDFFLFLDASTNDYALLYKRRDGGYGMLSPQRS